MQAPAGAPERGPRSAARTDRVLAAVLGLPAGAVTAVVASLFTPQPAQSVIDSVHEMRVPGGETLYDREVRLLRLKSPTPA